MTLINKLEDKLLNLGYKIYNSKDNNYIYKRLNDSIEEIVEVYGELLIVEIKTKQDQHKSFYPFCNFLVEGIEDLIKQETKQVGGLQ